MSEHTITELLSPAFLSRMQNMLGDDATYIKLIICGKPPQCF